MCVSLCVCVCVCVSCVFVCVCVCLCVVFETICFSIMYRLIERNVIKGLRFYVEIIGIIFIGEMYLGYFIWGTPRGL